MSRTLKLGTAAVATVALAAASATVVAPAAAPAATASPVGVVAARAHLTNLSHLDWLSVPVTPPTQEGHTTYRLDDEPAVGTLWTYAEPNPDGSYRHVGGGSYDAATDTWGQGAFNADDMARAAVVYLRHWKATGTASSRQSAYEMLRGVTYLQTATGPDAGNVVLWMQPDGTLNPSADPVELPDPSDSDASYWLARTIWALGEGYASFRNADPAFAGFLRQRLELSVAALDRQVLDQYGEHLDIDGQPAPAWLIADGADASAEAVLGLAAYVKAGGSPAARRALGQLSRGIAELGGGDARSWPLGAVRPWALSRSLWHAWGSQMPAALAQASMALDQPRLARRAISDSFTFDPWLLTSGGPDNGRMPTRGDASQIAYGADARLQSLLATADATGRGAARGLAGIVAAWYFGANPAGVAMYDPATGRTFDGISADGVVNPNSGAESTIHGLLSMIALDAHPGVADRALTATVQARRGTLTVQAEEGALSGAASSVVPPSLWTGESLFGGTGHAALDAGGSVTLTLPKHGASLVLPVLELHPDSSAVTRFRTGPRALGTVRSGDVGAQGDSPAPGALLPITLGRTLGAGATTLTATTRTEAGDPAVLDAVMLEPLVSRLVLRGNGGGTALLRSAAARPERARVRVAGTGPARITTYDGQGRMVHVGSSRSRTVTVQVPAGGFALVTR
ncbi:hypothetical protein [Nocardioides sp.]|uniref:hypothetical protein n=1 Tax=Nocardioides sp. TaxID=35761 RepID=UPI003D120AA9